MHNIAAALDELADLVAGITDDHLASRAARPVVADLECMVGGDLGDGWEPPLLARRFARAHRLLLATAMPGDGALARVAEHCATLRAASRAPEAADPHPLQHRELGHDGGEQPAPLCMAG